MMKETYCNFEISKWLKDKGFDCKASEIYMAGGEALSVRNVKLTNKQLNAINCVVRPTHQSAMAWLRNEKLLHIEVHVVPHDNGHERASDWGYDYSIRNLRTYTLEAQKGEYHTYEDAVDAALIYIKKYLL